jgi:hypothetical protein
MDSMNDIFLNSKDIEQVTNNQLLNHALHYSRNGFPVIPLHNIEKRYSTSLCSCRDGINCSFAGKHPRTRFGSKDASTNENKIFDWWEKHPNANIGLLAGKISGFFVLDIDIRTEKQPAHNGELSLEEMREYYRRSMKNYTPLSGTLTAFSGSGSRHLYFKYPTGLTVKNSASGIGLSSGLDIKSDGNYIIAPPSNHKSGNKYKWFGVDTPIEEAPNWLIYEIQKAMKSEIKPHQVTSSQYSKSKLNEREKIPVTQRNKFLHKYICGLVNSFPKEEVIRRAMEVNDTLFTEPLSEKSIISTVNWAWREFVEKKKK